MDQISGTLIVLKDKASGGILSQHMCLSPSEETKVYQEFMDRANALTSSGKQVEVQKLQRV